MILHAHRELHCAQVVRGDNVTFLSVAVTSVRRKPGVTRSSLAPCPPGIMRKAVNVFRAGFAEAADAARNRLSAPARALTSHTHIALPL